MDENIDEATLTQLEGVLGTKIYPGTEIMKDVGSLHFVKAGTGAHSVLVPQPSDAADDPLNWSPLWKGLAIFSATLVSFSLNLGPLALAPMFGSYIAEWNRSLADVVQFTGVSILCLGFSNFIWVPIMQCFGRRPVAIISTTICAGTAIWRARATSYNSFMGASILNGLAAGPCETLQPQVIADIIFLHQRGSYQTLYFAMYFISLMVGPIISGTMAQQYGWRSFWWFYTGLVFLTLACNVAFFPETRYHRRYANQATSAMVVRATEPNGNNTEQKLDNPEHLSDQIDVQTHEVPYLGRGRPTRNQMRLFQHYEGDFFRELWLPLYLHVFPVVEFASFVVSFSASAYLIVNLSQTQAFAGPPYNYSSGTIGLFNIAVLIGGLIGLFTCGPFSDWVAARLTERNNGIREPEMRLVAMIPYVIIMIIGCVLTGVGYDNHWPWQAVVVLGYACLGLQVAALPSLASTYAIDSYRPVTGSMFVTITINKNVWGYGVGKFITPWSEANGFVPVFMTVMGLTTLFCLCGIIFWYLGKRFRGMTKDSFVHKI
ncbi:major facilitator superfamily domain-containing protein [Xylariales sp. PMI_506]|nr:major facilitator superfamily domain-containing protein [Xylariales sp. PMI_506]